MSEESGATAVASGAAATAQPASAGSFSAEIPSTPAAAAAPAADRPFLDSIPVEYKDSAWAKEFAKNEKPWDALVKSHANALDLVGKKGVEIPGEGATAEQIATFNKAIGVPEAPAGYTYTPPDVSKLPEAVRNALAERAKDSSFIDGMRAIAHKAGVPAKQFAELAAGFDAQVVAQVTAQVNGKEAAAKSYSDTESKIFNELYGTNGEHIKSTAKDILAKIIPKSIQDSKNANLALVAAAMYINEKVFKNDTIGGANMGAPQMTKDQIRAKITELRAKPEFRDPFARDHNGITKQVDDLYNQLHAKPPGE